MKIFRSALLSLLTGFLIHNPASAAIQISAVTIEGGMVNIDFENPEGISYEFALENSTGLTSESWSNLPGASLSPVNATRFRFTIRLEDTRSEFFRVIGSFLTSVLDPDGDGLPTTLEESNANGKPRTDPQKFDTDGDGFGDGVEYSYGTDPTNKDDKPVFGNLPTVNFAAPNSVAREGAPPHQVEIAFDTAFTGTVNFAINSLSNTVAGADYLLNDGAAVTTGTVAVDGTTATIPLTLVDDTNTSGQRTVIIDLKLNGEAYSIGGRASHAVLLEDNDAWWTGVFFPDSGDTDGRIFRLKIARENSVTTVAFGSGAGMDGLPVPEDEQGNGAPAIDTTSISSSLVPNGEWPGTVVADTPTRFSVDSPQLDVPAGSLFGDEMIKRRLQLNAQASLNAEDNPHVLEELKYLGEYTETLTTSTGSPLAAFTGSFLLVRDVPAPLPVLSNLVPTVPAP